MKQNTEYVEKAQDIAAEMAMSGRALPTVQRLADMVAELAAIVAKQQKAIDILTRRCNAHEQEAAQ
jgi:hypothetical protein